MNSNNFTSLLKTLLVQLLITLVLLEAALRVWYFFHNRFEPPFSHISNELGWRPSPDLSFTYERKGYGDIQFSSKYDGFRRYQNPDSNQRKVLVIGDSFTQAYHVSDGMTYFDYLANNDQTLSVFAFAAGGYGTIQQAMVLDQYMTELNPDLVVWQFTGNDFINNDWVLESKSNENSSHMRRPYWQQGKIVRQHPDNVFGLIAEYSLIARRFLVIRASIRKRSEGSIEDTLGLDDVDLRRSIATTKEIIQIYTSKYPSVTYLSFFAGTPYYPWELDAYAEVCKIEALHCIQEVQQTLAAAAKAGEKIDGGVDGHWNENGHRLAGQTLLSYIQAR